MGLTLDGLLDLSLGIALDMSSVLTSVPKLVVQARTLECASVPWLGSPLAPR
jgi:hypothetical protein